MTSQADADAVRLVDAATPGSPPTLTVFCSPSRYTQGKNATAALGAEMTGLGLVGPALVVASRNRSIS